MGAVGAAFGRNLKPDHRPDLFDTPNPVTVSRQLLYRESFVPATSLNVLAAAWIQFQVHDWVNHRRYKPGDRSVEVPLPSGFDENWQNVPGGPTERVMRFAENPPEGFGFSDTAFRIFVLMASRRLQSDRFLTVDYRPEIYTPLGIDWVEKGGVNSVVLRHCPEKDLKLPLGALGPLRTQIEADPLLQNPMLTAEAMGLGAWIHASINPRIALGDPKSSRAYGRMLGFDFVTPRWRLADIGRWHIPLPKYTNVRSHPVGPRSCDGEPLIAAACPPAYRTMSEVVDRTIEKKFGRGGVYTDRDVFARIYREDYGRRYLTEASEYDQRVIDCAQDVCEYILRTHGRFPAHTDAIRVPGV